MMKQLFNIEGKISIITGGSRGIGEKFARSVPLGRIGTAEDIASAAI